VGTKNLTIVDLAGSEEITQVHLAEALQYHPKLDLILKSLE
jgi:predicted ATPase with chaperone activity